MNTWLPAVFVTLLALPFCAFWPDYEVARRALLALFAAVLVLGALVRRRLPLPGTPAGRLGLGCLLWATAVTLGNGGGRDDRFGHYLALAVCFVWGTCGTPRSWLLATLPAGILVALLGLAQASGLDWPSGLQVVASPVATLGNLNVASEVAALCTCAALTLHAQGIARVWSTLASGLGIAYLGANGSRSGLLALGLAALGWGVLHHREGRWKPLLLAAGCGLALLAAVRCLRPVAPAPAPAAAAAAVPSTIAVRCELWLGTLGLIAEAPVCGHGPGTFRSEYPRHRRDAEIELSSYGRSFRTTSASAHNDLLELAVEFGGVGLFAVALFALQVLFTLRRAPDLWLPALGPLCAFSVLAMVRSPLGNAPAAGWFFGFLGALCARSATAAPPRPFGPVQTIALGTGMLIWAHAAYHRLDAETAAARYVTQAALPVAARDAAPLARAAYSAPDDPRWRQLAIRQRAGVLDAQAAWRANQEDFAVLAEVDPHAPGAWLLRAEQALRAGELDAAASALARARALDRRDPEAQLLAATLRVLQGDAAAAAAELYRAPHPRLAASLAQHFVDLSAAAERRGDDAGAILLRAEQAFVVTLAQLAARPERAAVPELRLAVDRLGQAMQIAGLAARDARTPALRAVLDLRAGQEQLARDRGSLAQRQQLGIDPWVADLAGDLLAPLHALPEWQPLLARSPAPHYNSATRGSKR